MSMDRAHQELQDFVSKIAANCNEQRLIEMGWLLPDGDPMACSYCEKPFKTKKPLETHEGYCRKDKANGTDMFIRGLEGKNIGHNP